MLEKEQVNIKGSGTGSVGLTTTIPAMAPGANFPPEGPTAAPFVCTLCASVAVPLTSASASLLSGTHQG